MQPPTYLVYYLDGMPWRAFGDLSVARAQVARLAQAGALALGGTAIQTNQDRWQVTVPANDSRPAETHEYWVEDRHAAA